MLIILVGIWIYPKIDQFLKVDRCLDRGGRWNYEINQCEYSSANPAPEQVPSRGSSL